MDLTDQIIIPSGIYIARDPYEDTITMFDDVPVFDEEEQAYFPKDKEKGETEAVIYMDFPMLKSEDGPYEILLRKVNR